MRNAGKPSPKLRLKVAVARNRIVEVKSVSGRTIGHVIEGTEGGPTLLVAATSAAARSVFQRILLHPDTASLEGRLVLLFLDQLDHAETQSALDYLAACIAPVDATLFLEVPNSQGSFSHSLSDLPVETILNFCAKHGATNRKTPSDCGLGACTS